jgi:molecular chaperone GrpE
MTTRPEQHPPSTAPDDEAPDRPGTELRAGAGPDDARRADEEEAAASRADGRLDAAEFEDRWRRALADLANLRKRHVRELSRVRTAEREQVAAAFLPVLDNIDLALRHAESDPGAIVEGLRAIREQAVAVLALLGYPRQDEAGVPFDPALHEVVAVVPAADGTGSGQVVEVVRPGYGDAERQLRPSSVIVARDPET